MRVPAKKVTSILSAYQKDYPQHKKHQADFPENDALINVTKGGRGALPIIWLIKDRNFSGEIAARHVESTWGDIDFHNWIGEGNNPKRFRR